MNTDISVYLCPPPSFPPQEGRQLLQRGKPARAHCLGKTEEKLLFTVHLWLIFLKTFPRERERSSFQLP